MIQIIFPPKIFTFSGKMSPASFISDSFLGLGVNLPISQAM